MAILLDTFTGAAGALSAHTADSGALWTGSGAQAQLDGSGRLYCNTSNSSPNLVSNAVVPQGGLTVDATIFIGTLPSPATYNYADRLVLALWGKFDYAIEIDSRDSAHGNTPYMYVSATDTTGGSMQAAVSIASNTSHTIRWEIVWGVRTDIYIDGVLLATASPAPRFNLGSTALGGYFDRYQDSGAPNQPAMLYINTLELNAVAPPIPPAFWSNFTGAYELL